MNDMYKCCFHMFLAFCLSTTRRVRSYCREQKIIDIEMGRKWTDPYNKYLLRKDRETTGAVSTPTIPASEQGSPPSPGVVLITAATDAGRAPYIRTISHRCSEGNRDGRSAKRSLGLKAQLVSSLTGTQKEGRRHPAGSKDTQTWRDSMGQYGCEAHPDAERREGRKWTEQSGRSFVGGGDC
jgi:hypothetical protein